MSPQHTPLCTLPIGVRTTVVPVIGPLYYTILPRLYSGLTLALIGLVCDLSLSCFCLSRCLWFCLLS
ncbi:hypothetical protein C8F04DRAFT_1124254, partial [Mycena alexandri]